MLHIKVKLLSQPIKPLLYRVPYHFSHLIKKGVLVKIPFRDKVVSGMVTNLLTSDLKESFAIKDIVDVTPFPQDPLYYHYLEQLSSYYQVEPTLFIKKIQTFFQDKTEQIQKNELIDNYQTVLLTQEQQNVVTFLQEKIEKSEYNTTVIHGVTGSGKTEVYKRALLSAYQKGKTSLLLLPEVTLALQFETILKAQLPQTIPLYSFHSATTKTDKKLLWTNLLHDKPQIIIGVHLPIMLPLNNLGLIIIDEEHSVGFQEKKHPKINSKDAAIMRAQLYKIPLVLGSATPSVATLYNVQKRGWHLFSLTKRFSGAFAKTELVPLISQEKRRCFWITKKLEDAIRETLAKKEQAILFLNRRGVHFFMQCKECSLIVSCTSCSVSLTLHADEFLRCHYCSYAIPEPKVCSGCHKTEFIKKGIGTQFIVNAVQKLFPQARIARADLDTTQNKLLWKRIIDDFKNHQLDILVGTQTITKGYHFKKVTLVGVIWADLQLSIPFYNTQEVALQQLIQVAGRAGRQSQTSKVIIQSMMQHAIFSHIDEKNYLTFYEKELEQRALVGYPPCVRFAEIELKHKTESVIDKEGLEIVSLLFKDPTLKVLGPAHPPVSKIKNVYVRKIYLKAESFKHIIDAYKSIDKSLYKSALYFTPNPQQ